MSDQLHQAVAVTRYENILVITIDRAERRNAVNRDVSLRIAAALDELDEDPRLRVGVITGRGDNFCAGMDLKDFLKGDRPEVEGRGFAGITERPPCKPVIAAVEGFALAGGFELALACDLIVAGQGTWFGLPEACLGLVAGSGGLVRLARRLPESIALEYALTGQRMSAEDASRWGLVNRLVGRGEALAEALILASSIARNAPLSVVASKRIMNESKDWSGDEIWARQRPIAEAVINSADAQEGARAFAEKRDPIWSGH